MGKMKALAMELAEATPEVEADEVAEMEESMMWASFESLLSSMSDFELAEASRKVAEEMGNRLFARSKPSF